MILAGRSLVLIVFLFFFFTSVSFAMVPEQLEKTCERHVNTIIENCRKLSDLCCEARGKNARLEGAQKKAMAEYYTANKGSLINEMLTYGVDCHKEYAVKAFLIEKFFAFVGN